MEIMCNFKIISYINVLNTVQQQIVNIILILLLDVLLILCTVKIKLNGSEC